jgi:pyrroline-5-carboxylate reductase
MPSTVARYGAGMTGQSGPDVGFIGVGEIAAAIVDGLYAGDAPGPRVWLSPRGAATATDLARRHPECRVTADNQEVADRASVLLIAVRPDATADVLRDLRVPSDTVLISAVAGIEVDELTALVGEGPTIVRCIPLPAVRRRAGVTPIHPDNAVAVELFDRLGSTLVVPDEQAFAAFSAATGTVSANLTFLAAVADWLGRNGVAPALADRYVRELFAGVVGSAKDEVASLTALAAAHETAGGLNEQLRRTWFGDANAADLDAALDALLQRVRR